MTCPICNKAIFPNTYCHHKFDPYSVFYDRFTLEGYKTKVYEINALSSVLSFEGFIPLNKARIEKLLILK